MKQRIIPSYAFTSLNRISLTQVQPSTLPTTTTKTNTNFKTNIIISTTPISSATRIVRIATIAGLILSDEGNIT